jgi:D-alanine-D-alanine ligase
MDKLRIGLLFGGRSVEHEVSISSANSILAALDPSRYEVTRIAVGPDGRWHLAAPTLPLESGVEGEEVSLPAVPSQHTIMSVPDASNPDPVSGLNLDLVFPIIHGRGGEDGSLQGLLELAGVPYVGAGVLGSALQMDKEVSKRLLRAAGLPVTPWVGVHAERLQREPEEIAREILDQIGLPLFVKPANQGSSVGISRVARADELIPALREAARYDLKILAERGVDAREIEVALLGTAPMEASVPGEIRTSRDFYDYEAKYLDDSTELLVPAPIDEAQTREVQRLAIAAAGVLEATGLARVDFLMENGTGQFYINEVNSLPGFTDASMFPRLWAASGVGYAALLDRLVELALERHRATTALETEYTR